MNKFYQCPECELIHYGCELLAEIAKEEMSRKCGC